MAGPKTIVVLGMHRSGTSVVAGILHALGVDMGTGAEGERWIGKHWSNPTGHFENPAFLAMNQQLLGGDATGLRGTPRWEEVGIRAEALRGEIARLIDASQKDLWGWKDPWTVLTIEAFLPHLADPHFVIVHRPRAEVLASLQKRSSSTDVEIGVLYDLYERRLRDLPALLSPRPILSIDYPELLAEPQKVLARLTSFVGLRPDRDSLDRALGMVLSGEELHRQSQRMAVVGVLEFPRWVGWIVRRDLAANPGTVANDLTRAVPKELFQVLRAVL
ncbi:MAG TPA: sulfotransferase [Thermoplasmata archaeon]|nr:sulfotransferase [Thermoplasmata archaeon]